MSFGPNLLTSSGNSGQWVKHSSNASSAKARLINPAGRWTLFTTSKPASFQIRCCSPASLTTVRFANGKTRGWRSGTLLAGFHEFPTHDNEWTRIIPRTPRVCHRQSVIPPALSKYETLVHQMGSSAIVKFGHTLDYSYIRSIHVRNNSTAYETHRGTWRTKYA